MNQRILQDVATTVREWHAKDPEFNGALQPYSSGFIDGIKYTVQTLTRLGIAVPDAELFED